MAQQLLTPNLLEFLQRKHMKVPASNSRSKPQPAFSRSRQNVSQPTFQNFMQRKNGIRPSKSYINLLKPYAGSTTPNPQKPDIPPSAQSVGVNTQPTAYNQNDIEALKQQYIQGLLKKVPDAPESPSASALPMAIYDLFKKGGPNKTLGAKLGNILKGAISTAASPLGTAIIGSQMEPFEGAAVGQQALQADQQRAQQEADIATKKENRLKNIKSFLNDVAGGDWKTKADYQTRMKDAQTQKRYAHDTNVLHEKRAYDEGLREEGRTYKERLLDEKHGYDEKQAKQKMDATHAYQQKLADKDRAYNEKRLKDKIARQIAQEQAKANQIFTPAQKKNIADRSTINHITANISDSEKMLHKVAQAKEFIDSYYGLYDKYGVDVPSDLVDKLGALVREKIGRTDLGEREMGSISAVRDMFASWLAKDLGNVGVLTDKDIERTVQGLPDPSTTEEQRMMIFSNLRDIINSRVGILTQNIENYQNELDKMIGSKKKIIQDSPKTKQSSLLL